MLNLMKTFWPLVLIAFFLVCCGSDNPASEDSVDGDLSSSSWDSGSGSGERGSSGGHGGSGKSQPGQKSSSSAAPGVPDVVQDTLIQDTTLVEDVSALPECTSEKEGESFMVASENVLYFCMSN